MDLSAPVTGQIAFRDAVGESRPEGSWSTNRNDPWTYSLGVGVLHAPPGVVLAERVLGFVMGDRRGAGLTISAHGVPQDPDPEGYGDGDFSEEDMGGILGRIRVRSPSGFAGLLAHGGMVLRETRFPGPEGTVTHVVGAIVRTAPGKLPERVMHALGGTLGRIEVTDPVPAPATFPIGSTPCSTWSMPIWRARDGMRGFLSTLRLDAFDAMVEARALNARDHRTPDEEARLRALSKGPGGSILAVGRSDGEFERFKRLAVEMGVDVSGDADPYPDAAGIAARKDAVNRVVMAMREPTRPGMSP